MVKKVLYAEMRFFFCTHTRLYDLPTQWPTPDTAASLAIISFGFMHKYIPLQREKQENDYPTGPSCLKGG